MAHIPVLRLGKPYESLEQTELKDFRGEQIVANVSQANAGLIRKDLKKIGTSFQALQSMETGSLLQIYKKAASLFLEGNVPLGEGMEQSSDEYVERLSLSTGLPYTLCRQNMDKIHYVMTHIEEVLCGLTRGLDLSILDRGMGEQNGLMISYLPSAHSLGVVLPSNSPGVNSLWLPAIALKIPVILKPGREDPWTPYRLIQAFVAAGCPAEAFGFYPTDHEGATEVLNLCDQAILFGDTTTIERYASDPTIHVHGPGYSKVLIGEDQIDRWESFVPVMADSVALNSGRSCINASTIVVPSSGKAIAEAIAEKLNEMRPMPLEHEEARLSGFANPAMAQNIHAGILQKLELPGAIDISRTLETESGLMEKDGITYLLPQVVFCENREHPLARTEYLFPFVAVVEIPQSDMLDWIGPTLVASAITEDESFIHDLLFSPDIDRLNIGAISTPTVQWDQPHEGNLFECLYKRRAIQRSL